MSGTVLLASSTLLHNFSWFALLESAGFKIHTPVGTTGFTLTFSQILHPAIAGRLTDWIALSQEFPTSGANCDTREQQQCCEPSVDDTPEHQQCCEVREYEHLIELPLHARGPHRAVPNQSPATNYIQTGVTPSQLGSHRNCPWYVVHQSELWVGLAVSSADH